jgi:hypothetical protein
VADPRDIVDIPGIRSPAQVTGSECGVNAGAPKPWLGIWFRCCHTYGRLYKNASGRMYVGRCPKCGSQASVRVGNGGSNRRLFEAS